MKLNYEITENKGKIEDTNDDIIKIISSKLILELLASQKSDNLSNINKIEKDKLVDSLLLQGYGSIKVIEEVYNKRK